MRIVEVYAALDERRRFGRAYDDQEMGLSLNAA